MTFVCDHTFGQKKANASTFSHPLLVSPTTPTLANPVRGFGLTANTEVSTDTQKIQSADERSLLKIPI
ncbi:MAG: hypothetical protein KME59_02700 [Trichormus sp. ATA11-4-KO1]|jgi:hypothetical protein|nr:hypothetical protein [Trichormus sp. ATA11-4-KO1]